MNYGYYESPYYEDYLMHYGVKGMKWGVRKKTYGTSDLRNRYDAAKAEKKAANKAYSKSFDKAYNKSIAAYSPIKKHREANAARWEQASKDADKSTAARQAFKQVKNERKQAIKDTYKDIQKNTSVGQKLLYSDSTRKKAAKYVVDNNMSMKDATTRANKDAIRNTAVILAAYGAIGAGVLYKNTR